MRVCQKLDEHPFSVPFCHFNQFLFAIKSFEYENSRRWTRCARLVFFFSRLFAQLRSPASNKMNKLLLTMTILAQTIVCIVRYPSVLNRKMSTNYTALNGICASRVWCDATKSTPKLRREPHFVWNEQIKSKTKSFPFSLRTFHVLVGRTFDDFLHFTWNFALMIDGSVFVERAAPGKAIERRTTRHVAWQK